MSESLYASRDFASFYESYRKMHASPTTRRVHALATAVAMTGIALAVVRRRPLYAALGIAADYVIAQASHRTIEGNRTAPWRRPHWHLRAELAMFVETVLR